MCFGKFSSLVSRISGDANGDSHLSNMKGKMADRDWAHNFIQWRFNLPVCHPLATIMARVADFSKEAVSRFLGNSTNIKVIFTVSLFCYIGKLC